MELKKICIIGLGYIGLPTAAMFATHNHKIIGVDVNKNVVDALNRGKVIIEEPYLDTLVHAAVLSGNLSASTSPEKADVFIIAVPTPIKRDKTADMSYVKSAAESILPHLEKGNIIILESTSPPGTVDNLIIPILERSGLAIGEDLLIAHSPERVLPGRILLELVDNPRIIGGINQKSSEAVRDLYRTFVKSEIFLTDATTAEMCKLMENTFRDVNIALANELSVICENIGINSWEVIELSNKHPRVNIHKPGPGVGGHCLAVDPWFIVEKCPELSNIISLSRNTNDSMPMHVYNLIKHILQYINGVKKVTILGITYKPNVDDIRESPLIKLVEILEQDSSFEISIADPYVNEFRHLNDNVYEAASDSHLVVLGVDHDAFLNIDFEKLHKSMACHNILDTKNFWDRKRLTASGFNYYLLGDGKR